MSVGREDGWRSCGGVGGEDAPVGGVEVVGAVAEVFGEAEGMTAIGEEDEATGGVG